MNNLIFIESKNEISRYIYALHFAKALVKKKINILILDINQMNNFLDFPKTLCNFKYLIEEEPYKIKIVTITNKTDILKLPNELFLEILDNKEIINKVKIFIDYLVEKYDYIICTTFITNNEIVKLFLEKCIFVFDINDINKINEEEIIKKIKFINNKNINYKIVLKEYDKKNNLNVKKFLNLKKIFGDNLENNTFYFKEYFESISFINQKIYSKKSLENINDILDSINFFKN